jgi:hypothetical protein
VNERGCGSVLLTGLLLVLLAPLVLFFWPISLPVLVCWAIERRRPGLGLFLGGVGLLFLGLPLAWWVSDWGFVRYLTVPVAMVLLRAFDALSHDLLAATLPWVSLPVRVTIGATGLGLLVGGCLGSAAALARGRRLWASGAVALLPLLALPVLRFGPEMDTFRPSQPPWTHARIAAPPVIVARSPTLSMRVVTPSRKSKRKPFRISETLITCGQWADATPKEPCAGAPDLPKTGITWVQAVEYCNRISDLAGRKRFYAPDGVDWARDPDADGYRLPYDAEWVIAAQPGPVGVGLGHDHVAEWMWDGVGTTPGKSRGLHRLRGGQRASGDDPATLAGTSAFTDVGFRVALDLAADP